MREALCDVPGVEHVLLEFDLQGNGLLRVQVAQNQDHAAILGAAVEQMRRRLGLDGDQRRLRITDPSGRPVLAVVETLVVPGSVAPAPPAAVALALSGFAQLDPPPQPRLGRVVVERVLVSSEGQRARATVQLRCGEAVYSGTATGQGTGPGQHRALSTAAASAIASATTVAVEAVIGPAARLDVQDVDLLEVGHHHVAVVVLTLLGSTGIDRLTGSALLRDDPRDAIVRATLDALNRRTGIGGAVSGLGGQ